MRALLLDFDGVIVDSEHLHDQALRAVCEPKGFAWEGDAWVGWADVDVLRELYRQRGESLSDAALQALLEEKTRQVLAQVEEGLYHAYPGALELIREASASMPVVVCSAGLRGQIVPVLDRLGVLSRVTSVVGFEDVRRSKPDPEPYLLGAARAGVEPRWCVAIEDSPRGVASAVAAGCCVVAVEHTSPASALGAARAVLPRLADVSLRMLRELSAGHAARA